MEQNYEVTEGKTFTVKLPPVSATFSSRWCLKRLPQEFAFIEESTEQAASQEESLVSQVYTFGATVSENTEDYLEFVMTCPPNFDKVEDIFTARVKILPGDANGFMSYSENAAMKYGYPCGVQEANLKYGYPCGVQEANLKYGYPCGVQDAAEKCGSPDVQEEKMKDIRPYGFP